VFDFIYTVFLNTISLEITPFELSTYVVLSLLAGIGMADLIRRAGNLSSISAGTQRLIRTAFVVIPIVFLMMNYSLCNQRRNYTAYEHALNIFRTTGSGDILIIQGDNNLFPVIYGRMVERMREDLLLFDRFNVVFKLPYLGKKNGQYFGKWDGFRVLLEENLLKRMSDNEIYYVIFDPESVFLPSEYTLVPFGMLHRVAKKEELRNPYKIRNLWKYYSTESFHDSFERDYHSRQVGAHFLLRQGQYLFMAGKHEEGFEFVKKASRMGYDDAGIHASLAIFLVDQGLFNAARAELKKCEHYYEDPSIPQNNWGIYYYRRGEYAEAVTRFEEAIRIRPQVFSYYKNLGYALYELGKDKEAVHAFEKSLAINVDQPEIEDFMKENGLKK
jgi:tetratricopeptide (TPR) repeat protein